MTKHGRFTRVTALLMGAALLAGCSNETGEQAAVSSVVGTTVSVVGSDAAQNPGAAATVVRVLSGDSLEVDLDGAPKTLRLSGVAAPSTKDCLGKESQQALADQVPIGSTVQVDNVRTAGAATYAIVRTAGGSNVVASLVATGLAAVTSEAGAGVDQELAAASQTARADRAGLVSETISCTLPAQVQVVWCGISASKTASTTTTSAAATTSSTRASGGTTVAAACARSGDEDRSRSMLLAAIALKKALTKQNRSAGWLALSQDQRSTLVERADAAVTQHQARIDEFTRARAVEKSRSAASRSSAESRKSVEAEAARVAAEKAEQDRLAAEQAERERVEAAKQAERERVAAAEQAERDRVAAAQAEQNRVAAEQAERDRAAAEQAQRDQAAAEEAERQRQVAEDEQDSSGGGGGGGGGGYTGPRCYAPGGKTWKPC